MCFLEANLTTPSKIEEWIREVEERPWSAPLILRIIANRLNDLTNWNDELLAENIQLRSGQKVEEYESRIANLEYQIELLKRQLGGDAALPAVQTVSLLIYNAQGQVLRIELDPAELISGGELVSFAEKSISGQSTPELMLLSTQEEVLFLFDSGRTVTMPAAAIPAASRTGLSWEAAYIQEPRGGEELASLLPIAKMSLFEFCIQASRKGFVKKIIESYFETHLANDYIGTGVKLPADRTCSLTLCSKDDLFVMVSYEGFLFCMEAGRLPMAIEEALRLGPTDHIIAAVSVRDQPSILIVTQTGKIIHRESDWLEPAEALKTRGQALYSRERRAAGVRVVGAAAARDDDWGAALLSDGTVIAYKMSELFSTGSIPQTVPPIEVISFTTLAGDRPEVEKA